MRFMRSLSICVALPLRRGVLEERLRAASYARAGGSDMRGRQHDPAGESPVHQFSASRKWRAQPAFRARSTCRLRPATRGCSSRSAGHICIVHNGALLGTPFLDISRACIPTARRD